jgi:CheY-like chemotaxis protein
MDVELPEMDGVEATRHIRSELPFSRQPRIIALTAHVFAEDREKYLKSGMNDYISKPIYIDKLIEILSICKPLEKQTIPGDGQTVSSIDFTVIKKLKESLINDTIHKKLIDLYLQVTPVQLQETHQAIIEGNITEIIRLAHTIKSSSSYVGAIKLSHLCHELEHTGKSLNQEGAMEKLSQIKEEYEKVKSDLTDIQ